MIAKLWNQPRCTLTDSTLVEENMVYIQNGVLLSDKEELN
jgi:hypothetical protein